MPRIEFPLGLEGTENLPRTNRNLKNCFNNGQNRIIGRPGISLIKDQALVARGSFEWQGSLYLVGSQSLIKISNTTTGAFTTIGTIADSAVIRVAIGFNEAVIVVKGSNTYTLSTSDVLTDVTSNTNFVAFDDVAHINGRFVYIPSDGSPAKFSDVGAGGTIQALSIFDAEELPDDNNGVFNFANTLYITGTDSIQLYSDTGASPVPFISIQKSRILNGFIGGLLEYNNTFLFIGREKGQDRGIYSIAQGKAPKISNEKIDLIISKDNYTEEQIAAAITGRIKWRGYDIATFKLDNDSFGFFGGNWFELESIEDGNAVAWQAGFITQFEGEYFTYFSTNFGKFAKVNLDYGSPIERNIDFAFEQENSENFGVQSIELGISQGFNAALGTVALQLSRNGVQYSPQFYRDLGLIGQYDNKLIWNPPGGCGTYDGFMGGRIYTTEDVDFSADRFIVNYR